MTIGLAMVAPSEGQAGEAVPAAGEATTTAGSSVAGAHAPNAGEPIFTAGEPVTPSGPMEPDDRNAGVDIVATTSNSSQADSGGCSQAAPRAPTTGWLFGLLSWAGYLRRRSIVRAVKRNRNRP